jgi:flagellar protein FlbD
MIPLHRLTHPNEPLYINPDLIQTVEATPDTVVSLTNASKFVVIETPEAVRGLICDWRAEIVLRACGVRETESPAGIGQVVRLAGRTDALSS